MKNLLFFNSLFFALLILLIGYTTGFLPVSLGMTGTIPVLLLIIFALKTNTFQQRLFSITYLLGSFFCWIFGFLACYYLDFRIAQYPLITLILINIANYGALLGSIIIKVKNKSFFDNVKIDKRNISRKSLKRSIFIWGLIYFVYNFIAIRSGTLDARYGVGSNLGTGTALYFLSALSIVQYIFFLYLGMYLVPPLYKSSNIICFLVVLLGVILNSLSGGREPVVRTVLFFMFGICFSQLSRKKIIPIVIGLIIFSLISIQVVGIARVQFAGLDFNQRISLLLEFKLAKEVEEGSKYDDPLFAFFSRVTEPSGQLVIDGVYKTNDYLGFANIERAIGIFLPKFLIGPTKNVDDARERLTKYGLYANEFTAAPITLMADSFERFGYLGVFIISLLVSLILTYQGSFVYKLKNTDLKRILTFVFAIFCFRLYSSSLLLFIGTIGYYFPRDAMIIWVSLRFVRLTK